MRATKEKGEEAFRRYSEHVARAVLELMDVPVTIHDREFVDRVM
jgi:creatinine amidohydrolase